MAEVFEGPMARLPHVPDLSTLVAMTRRAGATSETEASRLVEAGLQVLSRTWSDAVRIRVVAAAPVDVARWLAAPPFPAAKGVSVVDDDPAAMLASSTGCGRPVADAVMASLARAFAEVVPPAARPADLSGR